MRSRLRLHFHSLRWGTPRGDIKTNIVLGIFNKPEVGVVLPKEDLWVSSAKSEKPPPFLPLHMWCYFHSGANEAHAQVMAIQQLLNHLKKYSHSSDYVVNMKIQAESPSTRNISCFYP